MTQPAGHDLTNTPTPEERADQLADRDYTRPWMRIFIRALTVMPNISVAARAADVTRSNAYLARDHDADFAAAWDEAKEVALDLLEQIAHQRATTGEERRETRTVTKRVDGHVVEETTTVVTRVHVSDGMLLALLRRHRPAAWRDTNVLPETDAPPRPVEVYRIPSPERRRELLRLASELEPAAVVEGTATRVNGTNGPEPGEA